MLKTVVHIFVENFFFKIFGEYEVQKNSIYLK